MSMNIVNKDVEDIIKRALETAHLDDVQAWPGTDFDMMSDAGKALLGESFYPCCKTAWLSAVPC
jgi:hypothetical protein